MWSIMALRFKPLIWDIKGSSLVFADHLVYGRYYPDLEEFLFDNLTSPQNYQILHPKIIIHTVLYVHRRRVLSLTLGNSWETVQGNWDRFTVALPPSSAAWWSESIQGLWPLFSLNAVWCLQKKVGMRNLNHFLEVKPVRFFDKSIDIKGI